ncbi:hypothetical protein C8F04DRAFT_50712 [Mycena alexandri]|uniref:Zn(2)-C6 fungal-type domain-containing protein n=1 Tax=Mycena alexandri TaxID=1745969 RepID=A0AAD6WVC0_9AGAR|nr:hypothetical protein C8F04DRAFT_50712 [Mycena alexandri]
MPKEGGTKARGTGSYASQACKICRAKKSKCDGIKPVCGSCAASGRHDECAWGKDTAPRRPRTDAHFEALRKRADSLQAYVDLLERLLAKCVCQDASSHLQFRPQPTEEGQVETDGHSDTPSDDEITQELTASMRSLKVDDQYRLGGLLRHGITAPFRFLGRLPNEVSQTTEVIDPNASYILLVDGVDESQAHPDIDWSRHLPSGVLLDRKEHDKVLSTSFKFFLMWCLRIPPSLFFRDMYRALSVPISHAPPRTPNYSPMLHNALFAVSAIFSDDPYIRDATTRLHFADAAKACIEAECKKPDLSFVQALALLGTFFGDLGDRIYGDLYFGMCGKISMALGLNVDFTGCTKPKLMALHEMHVRNWTHWSLFSLDVCLSLYNGRDCVASQRTTAMPFVDLDFDLLPWYHAPAKIPPQPNFLTLAFNQSVALFVIGRKIVDLVNGLTSRVRKDDIRFDEQITKIDLELNSWKDGLPPALNITLANRTKSTPQRLMLHLQYWWCFIVLHQPFFTRQTRSLQRSDPQVDHVKLCTRAADNILELVETWSSLYSLRFSPITMLQIIFSAGTVFLLRALDATRNQRIAHASLKTALAQVEQCVRYLHEMGRAWRNCDPSSPGDSPAGATKFQQRCLVPRRSQNRSPWLLTSVILTKRVCSLRSPSIGTCSTQRTKTGLKLPWISLDNPTTCPTEASPYTHLWRTTPSPTSFQTLMVYQSCGSKSFCGPKIYYSNNHQILIALSSSMRYAFYVQRL